MGSYAGTTLMGSTPVAGARAVRELVAGAHGAWQYGTKHADRILTAVPDTNRTRRPRGPT